MRYILISLAVMMGLPGCGVLAVDWTDKPVSDSELLERMEDKKSQLLACDFFKTTQPGPHNHLSKVVIFPYFIKMEDDSTTCARAQVGGGLIEFNNRKFDKGGCTFDRVSIHELLHVAGMDHDDVFYKTVEECK